MALGCWTAGGDGGRWWDGLECRHWFLGQTGTLEKQTRQKQSQWALGLRQPFLAFSTFSNMPSPFNPPFPSHHLPPNTASLSLLYASVLLLAINLSRHAAPSVCMSISCLMVALFASFWEDQEEQGEQGSQDIRICFRKFVLVACPFTPSPLSFTLPYCGMPFPTSCTAHNAPFIHIHNFIHLL